MSVSEVLAAYARFESECEAAEYTDIGDAWVQLNALASTLQMLSLRVERMARQGSRVRAPSEIRALLDGESNG